MSSTIEIARMFAPKAYAPASTRGLMRTLLIDKTAVYVFPRDLTKQDAMALGLLFTLMGTSTTATLEEWKSYVCSYTCYLLPDMLGKLPKESYQTISVTRPTIAPTLLRIQQYVHHAYDETEEANPLADDGLQGVTAHAGLPKADAGAGYKWVGAECSMKHIYAHYSLVVFLAGKQITDLNRAAITEKRPLAIIGKCSLDETTLILNGPLRLSDASHLYIHTAWSEMTIFRAQCFLEFMNYASMNVNFAQDIIYTSVHLLRFSGLAHARFSYKLIKSNPWVREFAPLQSSIAVFEDSLKESMKVPPPLQPYLKLIYADKSSLFPRKEMEPLVACAVALEEQLQESVGQFFRSDKYAALVDLFLEERSARMSRTVTRQVTTLAELEEQEELGSQAAYALGGDAPAGGPADQEGEETVTEEQAVEPEAPQETAGHDT